MQISISDRTFLYFMLVLLGIGGFFFSILLPPPTGFYAFIVISSLAGLGVCLNIYDTKKHNRELACPTGSNCNVVVTSRYSKFFGIALEYWGIGYFSLIAIFYGILIIAPHLFTPLTILGLVLFSAGAGLFSMYLLFVQAFLLRQWCIWCILAALLSLTIFITSLVSADAAISFLANISGFLEMLVFLGFALGLGSATSAGFLFSHSLKGDRNIDEPELESVKAVSEIVWVGLALVLISQFARHVGDPGGLFESSTLVAQIIALFIAAVAGAVHMIVCAPFLVYIPFDDTEETKDRAAFRSIRRPILTLGAIALASWYFAFVMNFVSGISLPVLLVIFLAVLIAAVLLALVWENSMRERV